MFDTTVRVNAKGEITIPWELFRTVHPDEIMDVVEKKSVLREPHIIRPMSRKEGVKQFL